MALFVAQGVNGQSLIVVPVGDQQLGPFVHSAPSRAAFALPGRNVIAVRGRIIPAQVQTARPSYINALLIQSRGVFVRVPCTACARQMDSHIRGWAQPFPVCVRLYGHFGGCCGNCKWRDHGSRCSVRNDSPEPSPPGNDDDDDDDSQCLGSRPRRLGAPPPPDGSSAGNALVLA